MKKLTHWERLLFFLSVYVVLELYIASIVTYSEQTKSLLLIIDTIICGFFLLDFFYGFYKAENRSRYLKSHWIDFISSIPMIGILRLGRIVKIIRVLRIVRSGKLFYMVFNRYNSLRSLRNLSIIILFSVSIYQLEKEVNPAMDTLAKTFWWTINTTITFGFFQGVSPESIEGRIFSVFLILMGMVLFGTFISFVTDYFVTEENVHEDVRSLHLKMESLNKKLDMIIDNQGNKDLENKDESKQDK